jgi:hypothetical protein
VLQLYDHGTPRVGDEDGPIALVLPRLWSDRPLSQPAKLASVWRSRSNIRFSRLPNHPSHDLQAPILVLDAWSADGDSLTWIDCVGKSRSDSILAAPLSAPHHHRKARMVPWRRRLPREGHQRFLGLPSGLAMPTAEVRIGASLGRLTPPYGLPSTTLNFTSTSYPRRTGHPLDNL